MLVFPHQTNGWIKIIYITDVRASNFYDFLIPGVTITPVDDNTFQVFAPNQVALDEAKEKIEELLAEEVRE